MSAPLKNFNSQMLELAAKFYRGPFQDRLIRALSAQSTREGLLAMFPSVEIPSLQPTLAMVYGVGRGDVGSDTAVFAYYDALIGRALAFLAQEDAPFNQCKQVLASETVIDTIQAPIENKALQYRFQLIESFHNFFKLIPEGSEVLQGPHRYIEVQDSEDISFMGVCLYFLTLFFDRHPSLDMEPGFINDQFVGEIFPIQFNLNLPEVSNERFPTLDILATLNESGMAHLRLGSTELGSTFRSAFPRLSKDLRKDALPANISNLLGSSVFLWSGLDFDRVYARALNDSERLYAMRRHKYEIVRRCVNFLGSYFPPKNVEKQNEKLKIRIFRSHEQVQRNLRVFEDRQTELARAIASRAGAEDGLIELMRNFGSESTEQEQAQLLEIIKERPIPTPLSMGRLGILIVKLGDQYRRQTLIQEALKEKISLLKRDINFARNVLKKDYEDLIKLSLSRSHGASSNMNALMAVHCVFSFFVFNADVFPQIDLSLTPKQVSAFRIGKMFLKKKQRKVAFEESTDFTQTLVKSLNDTAENLFQNFVDLVEGQQKALSAAEILSIKKMSEALLASNKEDKKKFASIERILKKLLIENSGFYASFNRLRNENLNLEQIADLQVHFNTCLLAAEHPLFVDATGQRNSVGFSNLSETIEKCLVPDRPNMDLFTNSKAISKQLLEFQYPPHLAKSFQENITSVFEIFKDRPDQMSLIDLEANPINPVHFEHLRKKKEVMKILRNAIVSKLPEGDTVSLSKPKAHLIKALEHETGGYVLPSVKKAINSLTEIDGHQKVVAYFERRPFLNKSPSTKEAINLLEKFVLRNNIDREFLKDKGWIERIQYNSWRETTAIVLAWIHEILWEEYTTQMRSLSRLHSTSVVPATSLQQHQQKRAGVFDSTSLFGFYKRKFEDVSVKEKISNDMFDLFLPVFLSSYCSDAANLQLGRAFFLPERIENLKKVFPNSEVAIYALDGYLRRNHERLISLSRYFSEEENNATFESPAFFAELQAFMKENFSDPVQYVGEKALQAALLAVGITMWTGSPIVGILGGIAIAAFWETGIGTMGNLFKYLRENYRFYFGNSYTVQGVNDYLLDTLKVAFLTEVQMCQGENVQGSDPIEPQNLLRNVLFLQEEFSIFENMQSSWNEFQERLNMLVPHSLKQTGMSILILNIFHKANSEVFNVLPVELLRDVKNKYFLMASLELILDFRRSLYRKMIEFLLQGNNISDCSLEAGDYSPFKDWLEGQLQGQSLSFEKGTMVQSFFQELYQTQDSLQIPLTKAMLVPFEKITDQFENFDKLTKLMPELLSYRGRFLGYANPVLLQNKDILKPTLNHLQTYKKFCRSCFFILNYSFSLARKLNNLDSCGQASGTCDYWLAGLNETARGVLLSPLYKETFSLLYKVAEFAKSSGLQEGSEILSHLNYLRQNRQTFLDIGILDIPNAALMARFEKAILDLIGKAPENPQIITPVLVENETNPSINLPIICWDLAEKNFLKAFGRAGAGEVLHLANSSETIALTNQMPELYFSSYDLRGFALTPFMVTALQNAVQRQNNIETSIYLGQRTQQQQIQAQQQAVARSQQPSQISQEQLNQLFASRGRVPETEPLPQPQAIMPQAQAIGPPLEPNQYPSALGQPQPQQAEQQQPDMQPQQAQAAAVAAAMPPPQAQQAPVPPQPQPQAQPMPQQVGDLAGQPALVQPASPLGQEQMPQSMLPMLMVPPAPPAPQAAGAIPQEQQPMPQPQYNPPILAGAAGERQAARIASGMDPLTSADLAQGESLFAGIGPRPPDEPLGPPPARPYRAGMGIDRFHQVQAEVQAQEAPTGMGNWQKAGMGIALAGLGGYALKKMFDSPEENLRRGRRG